MTRAGRISTIVAAALTTAACASFEGMPRPVIDPQIAAGIPDEYKMATVLKEMEGITDETRRKALRNRTIGLYIAAADARYHQFRLGLSKGIKGGNLGFDLGVLALTGVGSIAGSAANELSAAAAGLTGARSAVNKELYFEKTLPAIIAAMDTNRLRLRGEILRRLREDSTVNYPLEQAFADFGNYQMAGSIDGAIQQITTATGQAAAAEEEFQRFENATESCSPTTEVRGMWLRLGRFVHNQLAKAAPAGEDAEKKKKLDDLATIAAMVSDTPQTVVQSAGTKAEADAQANGIAQRLAQPKYCSAAALNTLFAEITAKTGRKIP